MFGGLKNWRADETQHVVIYSRLPGLLAHVAEQSRSQREVGSPIAVVRGRIICDASPVALSCGVRVGQSTIQARRLCPTVLIMPLEDVNYQSYLRLLLDTFADISPVVEPDAPNGAYAMLNGCDCVAGAVSGALLRLRKLLPPVKPLMGMGISRLASRACAECGLPPDHLAHASVRWLWPEDEKVVARLMRLGLATFGAIQALPETALVYQFGRVGRLLHRRAKGEDLTPVRAVYPPPRADARKDFTLEPLHDSRHLDAALSLVAANAAHELKNLSRYGRRARLYVATECGEQQREACLSSPVQEVGDVATVALRLLRQIPITAPVTGLRLLVEDLDVPTATTANLFATEQRGKDLARLEATKRLLTARYGQRGLTTLSELPVPVREQRRILVLEHRNRKG